MQQALAHKSRFYRISQSHVGGQFVGAGRVILFIVGLFALSQFWFINRPIPERIESQFSMTLPDSARDFGWFDYSGSGYDTLAKFTVDSADLDATMQSVRWETDRCISRPRQKGYMPDFYVPAGQDWWHPYDAVTYDGVTCNEYNPNGLAPNHNVMVDYTTPGQATVYIEVYSVDARHRRALWEGD